MESCEVMVPILLEGDFERLKRKQNLKATEAESLNLGCFCKFSWTLSLQMILVALKQQSQNTGWQLLLLRLKAKWQSYIGLKGKKKSWKAAPQPCNCGGLLIPKKNKPGIWIFSLLQVVTPIFILPLEEMLELSGFYKEGLGWGKDLCHLKTGPQTGVRAAVPGAGEHQGACKAPFP